MSRHFPSFSPIFEAGTLYLAFLHLHGSELPAAFAFVRNACASSVRPANEIKSLLEEVGWREHLVAAAAILTNKDLVNEVADDLWRTFDTGSWVSPQLAVVASLRDPQFAVKARVRIRSGCPQDTKSLDALLPLERHVVEGPASTVERSAKSLSALVYLVGLSLEDKGWLTQELQRDETRCLLAQDADFGGRIAENWLTNLRQQSNDLGIEII